MIKTQKSQSIHKVLRALPYGLYVVGVRGKDSDQINALVASWVTQCSFEPPLLLVALRAPSSSHALVKQGKVFSLNLLHKTDQAIARQLVKPSRRAGDKLAKISHAEEDTGAPILREAFAFLECKVKKIYEPGDHALVIGEVINAAFRKKGNSLLCSDLRWHYAG